ncbi:hypothetical protein [Ornithinibacillus xuwenensis]|jgi:hypothetical protein|uniref:Uncharacterized protein n=1 Tax=Ornithinibacillus xuwenensis TaxID=3144668 RepID=A0ABU9XGY8_9BACI
MKSTLFIIGGLLVIALAAFLDSPSSNRDNTIVYDRNEEQTIGVDAEQVENSASTYFEFRLEEMNEVDDYIVETYQEYEVHEDAAGNVIVRIPTSKYNYLKYQKE